MRKVTVEVVVKLTVTLNMDENVEVAEAVSEIDYSEAVCNADGVDIEDIQVEQNISHEVKDSR